MKKRWITLLLIALIFCVGCEDLRDDLLSKGTVFAPKETVTQEPETKEAVKEIPEDKEITISAIGDVLSHGYCTKAAKTESGYDYLPQFEKVQNAFDEDDFTIANLESMTAGKEFGYTGYPSFNAPENLSETLKKIGVDAVSTANNHAMDKGAKAVPRNLENVRNIGLIPFGTAASEEERNTPVIVDVEGIKVGLLSYTYGTNGIPVKNEYAVNLIDPEVIRKDIERTRKEGAEIISVSMHWGVEYTDHPIDIQKELTTLLEEEGVDIVLGCHPHVVQPIELRTINYKGEEKKMAIIYSLGNFYSGQTQPHTKSGIIFRVKVKRENGKARVASTDYTLTYVNSWVKKNGITTYSVLPVTDPEEYSDLTKAKEIKKEFERLNELVNSKVE
ncbi:CapA family protein [Guggenheimella bovis]